MSMDNYSYSSIFFSLDHILAAALEWSLVQGLNLVLSHFRDSYPYCLWLWLSWIDKFYLEFKTWTASRSQMGWLKKKIAWTLLTLQSFNKNTHSKLYFHVFSSELNSLSEEQTVAIFYRRFLIHKGPLI